MSIRKKLDSLGKDIVKEAKKNAKPNKKTGKLDRSIDYDVNIRSLDDLTVTIEEVHYGKYLNDKTNYMDKAISTSLDRHLDDIVDELIDDITKDILE